MKELVDYINQTTVCTIAPSPLGGVGVFAIQDIKAGTLLSEYTFETLNMEKEMFELDEEHFNMLLPAVKSLILDRILLEKDQNMVFLLPNHEAYLKTFMNHSDTPNSTGYVAIKDIKAGEEVTFDYKSTQPNFHQITKDHMPFLWK